jgi:hypothetical protein
MKTIWLIICLPVALLSCSRDADDAADTPGPAIGFTTEINAGDTRGLVADLAHLQTTGFAVSAYPTGATPWSEAKSYATPTLMHNTPVTYSSGSWTYTAPAKYWPVNNGKVTFFAWNVPGITVSGNSVTGAPILTYRVGISSADQRDLMTGVLVDKTASGGNVKFAFRHVLARIGFAAKLDKQYPNETVTVTSLIVGYTNAVKSKGTYTFGDTDNAEGMWELDNTPMSGDINGLMSNPKELNNDNPPKATPLNDPDKYLMLMPQTVAAGAIKMTVEWTVTSGGITITASATYDLPEEQTWLPGKYYEYVLTIKAY